MPAPGGSLVTSTYPRIGASTTSTGTRPIFGSAGTILLASLVSKPGASNLKLARPGCQKVLMGVTTNRLVPTHTVAPGGSLFNATPPYGNSNWTRACELPFLTTTLLVNGGQYR